MSGFFSQIAGSLLSGGSPVAAALPGVLSQLLGTTEGATGGSLPVLLAAFENAGLGDKVKSWLGPNENVLLTAEEVVQAIPPEQLNALADRAGIPHDQLASVLAQVLPHAVDHATPDGQVPAEGADLPNMESLISKILSK